MTTSTPTNVTPTASIIVLAITTIAGGILSGIVMFISTRLINMMSINAILAGLVGTILFTWAIGYGKIRDKVVAAVFGVIMGVIAYGSYQVAEYIAFRVNFYNDVVAAGEPIDRAQVDAYLDSILIEETGSSGFVGFIKYSIQYGFSITSTYNPLPREVSGGGVLFYWGLDFLFLTGISAYMGWKAAGRSFCEHCQKFYGGGLWSWKMGEPIGSVPSKSSKEFISTVKSENLRQAMELLAGKGVMGAGLDLYVERCETCDTSPINLVAIQTAGMFGNTRRVALKQEISSHQYDEIKRTL